MAGKLKPLEVARQVTPGKYPDGDGLYLIVTGPTSRNWSYRYWIKGKERWHGLGSLWSKKHAAQWPSSLKQYAYPTICAATINLAG
jgi:hypothetical protein